MLLLSSLYAKNDLIGVSCYLTIASISLSFLGIFCTDGEGLSLKAFDGLLDNEFLLCFMTIKFYNKCKLHVYLNKFICDSYFLMNFSSLDMFVSSLME